MTEEKPYPSLSTPFTIPTHDNQQDRYIRVESRRIDRAAIAQPEAPQPPHLVAHRQSPLLPHPLREPPRPSRLVSRKARPPIPPHRASDGADPLHRHRPHRIQPTPPLTWKSRSPSATNVEVAISERDQCGTSDLRARPCFPPTKAEIVVRTQ